MWNGLLRWCWDSSDSEVCLSCSTMVLSVGVMAGLKSSRPRFMQYHKFSRITTLQFMNCVDCLSIVAMVAHLITKQFLLCQYRKFGVMSSVPSPTSSSDHAAMLVLKPAIKLGKLMGPTRGGQSSSHVLRSPCRPQKSRLAKLNIQPIPVDSFRRHPNCWRHAIDGQQVLQDHVINTGGPESTKKLRPMTWYYATICHTKNRLVV